MRSRIPRSFVAVLALGAGLTFLAGCQQPEAPNEKQARLFAAENRDLQQKLAAQQTEIQVLRQKHAQELRQRDDDIARCKARIEALQKDLEKGIAERVGGVTTTLMNENARLRKEVEDLKAQIEKLKAASTKESSS